MHLLLVASIAGTYLFTSLLNFNEARTRKIQIFLIGLILFLFAALRGHTVGVDIIGYISDFDVIASQSWSEIIQNEYRDFGWPVFVKLVSVFFSNYQWLLVVIGAWVALSFSYLLYNTNSDILLTTIFFVTFRVYAFTLTGLRQSMAMGFVFFAIVFILRKKYWKALFFILIASLFHASAIAFILSFLLIKIKSHLTVPFISVIVLIICIFTNYRPIHLISNLVFNERFDGYIDTAIETNTNVGMTMIIYICMFLFILLFIKGVKNYNPSILLLFNMATVFMMFNLIGSGFPNMFRIAYYFVLPFYILVTEVLQRVIERKSYFVTKVIMFILLAGQYVIIGPGAGIDNYVFFWAL